MHRDSIFTPRIGATFMKYASSFATCRLAIATVLAFSFVPFAQGADPYADAARYRIGQPKDAISAIEAEIRSAKPDKLRAIEMKLIGIVQSGEATADAKSWACRTLRIAGSEQSVPALAALLTDKQLAADAQFALRSIASPKVDEALVAAIPKTEGLLKAGVVQTLGARGMRRDTKTVCLLVDLARDADPAVAEAALYALGQIGDADSIHGGVADSGKRQHAILLCAERLLAEGQRDRASVFYFGLYTESHDPVIQRAALRGLVLTDQAKEAAIVIEALKKPDRRLRQAAAKALCECAGDELLTAALGQFGSYPPDAQATILELVARPAALPAVRAAVASPNQDIRVAAIGALGRLGDASSVPVLLKAATEKGLVQAAARKNLQVLRGQGVNDALLDIARSEQPEIRAEAILALSARNAVAAVPAILDLAKAAEPAVRLESLKALAQLAEVKEAPSLVAMLVESNADRERAMLESALISVARRASDKDAAIAPLLAALPSAKSPARCSLLRVLAQSPSAKAFEVLRVAVKQSDAAVRETAVRGLAAWPDAAALPVLEDLARTADSPTHRVLALRGFIRLAQAPSSRPPEQTVKMLAVAMQLAPSASEKVPVLSALSEIGHASALDLATGCLSDPTLEVEAASAVVRLARKLQSTDATAAGAAVQKILDTCKSPAARQIAEGAGVVLKDMVNIAPQGTASSPDGLEKDGESGGDQAAIDGNPATYWDEADGAKLYRLVVTFKQPEKIAALSITGWAQHQYAPKDFEVLCDGRPVKKVDSAEYHDNFFVIPLPETTCKTVELKITGYYGGSPAIRELGIYRRLPKK